MPGNGLCNHLEDLLVAFPFFEGDGQHVDLPHLIARVHVEGFGCEGMAPYNLLNIIDHRPFYGGSQRGMGIKTLFGEPDIFTGG